MENLRHVLSDGVVEGVAEQGVRRFLSLPYAAPLTDARRFREPQPVEPWSGVRDATVPGCSAPQDPVELAGLDMTALLGRATSTGRDYLTLNVWAPDDDIGGRPVMVFVHGGGFVSGSKDAAVYDGASYARHGVVCVTLNYRLGIEGFLPIPGAPTNLGLRDILQALRWIRDNIAGFGGDPANVTLSGESAGAACVGVLMLSPLSTGLFRRVICQSGHPHLTRAIAPSQWVVRRLAKRLRVTPDRSGFAGVSAERLLAAQAWMLKPSLAHDLFGGLADPDDAFGSRRFGPVFGDDVVPLKPLDAQRQGVGREVDLLIGCTAEEANFFFAPGGLDQRLKRWQTRLIAQLANRHGPKALEAYRQDEPDATPGAVLARALTDLQFRHVARRTAALHRGRAWIYEFDWRSPALDGRLGAAHTMELPFTFNTLAAATGEGRLLGRDPPQALADTVHGLWIRFATHGSLPWPPSDPSGPLVFSLVRKFAQREPMTPAAQFLP